MPSVAPPTSWPCGLCKTNHPVQAGPKPKVYCPTLKLLVYSPSALEAKAAPPRDWTKEHDFEQSPGGFVFCVDCGKEYEELQAEEEARFAQ